MINKTPAIMHLVIDRRSNEPYAEQLVTQIKNLILRHQTDPILVDVKFLAKSLEIEEHVVIDAFNQLVEEKFYEQDASGNYQISYREVVVLSTDSLYSIAQIIDSHGQRLRIDSLEVKTIQADKVISEKTGFKIGTKLYYQYRIYFGDDIPKAVYRVYFDASIYPDANSDDNINRPYYHFTNYDIKKSPSDRYVTSIRVPDEINDLLDQKHGTAGFYIVEKIFTEDGKQGCFAEGYFNINYMFQYSSKIKD